MGQPRKHVIRVWYNKHNNYEAVCTCQWGAVGALQKWIASHVESHKGYWVWRGDEVVMEGEDGGRGFEESLRAAIERVAPQPEPTPASETGPGPKTLVLPRDMVATKVK